MDRIFPFGFPGPTAFYLVLYVATLAVHVIFMGYVLSGTAVVAGSAIAGLRRRPAGAPAGALGPVVELLRDWLPFALSAAITAGIAPLLLIQILYKRGFYTANLLLFHRWMLIVPALIAGFYLLYLLRTQWLAARPRLRVVVGALAVACFGFTALSWTENSLLARDPAAWAGLYGSGAMAYRSGEIAPRLGFWVAGTMPTMAALIGWQVWRKEKLAAGSPEAPRWAAALRPLAGLALAGLALAAVAGGAYAVALGPAGQASARSPAAAPYLWAAIGGAGLQAAAWAAMLFGGFRGPRRGLWLGLASVGLAVTVPSTAVVREALRIGSIEPAALAALHAEHARAADVGGRWLFFVFLALNAALAAWAIRTATRKAAAPAA